MDFAKFISFLSTGALYFARVDRLGDDSEGAIPLGSAASFHAFVEKARLGGPEAERKDWRTAWLEAYEREKWSIFVSCWYCKKQESDQMWTKYAKPYGLAIRSTYEQLNASLPLGWNSREVLLGLVSYGDYDSPEYVRDVTNHFNLFMSKRLEHEDDHEVRAVIGDWRITREEAMDGLAVSVLSHTLVEAVVTAPGAPDWFVDTVAAACRAFNLDVPVERSALDRVPRVPF